MFNADSIFSGVVWCILDTGQVCTIRFTRRTKRRSISGMKEDTAEAVDRNPYLSNLATCSATPQESSYPLPPNPYA